MALSREVAMANSPAWLNATAQAAVLFAGSESANVLSTQAVAWAQGALKAMAVGKFKIAATLILAFGVLAAGSGLAVYQLPATEEAKAKQEKLEARGRFPFAFAFVLVLLLSLMIHLRFDGNCHLQAGPNAGQH
jgi:hypothetical protein